MKITDKQRLEWLIKKGYTPCRWRYPRDPMEHVGTNGMVWVGPGKRKEIDKAMRDDANRDRR